MKLKDVHDEVKHITRTQKILISVIAVFVLLGSIVTFTGTNALTSFGYDAFTMLRYSVIDHPVEVVRDWMTTLSSLRSVQQENDELRATISSQRMYKAELDNAKQAVEEMEELMAFSSNINYEKINATIITRDASTWSNTITINKGSNDGIEMDMAVISSRGLIGKVSEVHGSLSKVRLLTNENDEISVSIRVMLEDGSVAGILDHYNASENLYYLQLFDANAEVSEDMEVVTSGDGGVFPSGILIGRVSTSEESYDTKGKVVTVRPSVDFNDFSYVSVLKVQ